MLVVHDVTSSRRPSLANGPRLQQHQGFSVVRRMRSSWWLQPAMMLHRLRLHASACLLRNGCWQGRLEALKQNMCVCVYRYIVYIARRREAYACLIASVQPEYVVSVPPTTRDPRRLLANPDIVHGTTWFLRLSPPFWVALNIISRFLGTVKYAHRNMGCTV